MSKQVSTGGIGFFGLTSLILMTLKLLDKIDISWTMVFLPALVPLLLFITTVIFVLCVSIISECFK